jgi:hypothetical protein
MRAEPGLTIGEKLVDATRLTALTVLSLMAMILILGAPHATGQSAEPTTTKVAGSGASPTKTGTQSGGDTSPQSAAPVYTPPDRGAPTARIGGGTDELWLNPPIEAGIHAYRLKERRVNKRPILLELGRRYAWGVEVISSPARPSQNRYAGSWIELVLPSNPLRARLAATESPFSRAAALAEEGIWYDAMAELSQRGESAFDEKGLREMRAAFLEQVGLMEVAAYERGRPGPD